ncbi:MAG: YdcF family protein [Candidatus Aminicenantes bacterium]|nr:YdcF family protein [Candidatus Aminicenantes bacterium]
MFLMKILDELVMPSVFILVFIMVGIILLKLKKRKTGWIFITGSILIYYFFSITPVADLIIAPLEKKYAPLNEKELAEYDTVVFLLGGPEGNILRAGEVFRIYAAWKKYREKDQPFRIIVSGSYYLYPGKAETDRVRRYFIERGIPEEYMELEYLSKTTGESAREIKKLNLDKSFLLVTSAYHMYRSMKVFRKAGLNPVAAPTDFKKEKKYDIYDFFPSGVNLRKTEHAFHEYFGLLYYSLIY